MGLVSHDTRQFCQGVRRDFVDGAGNLCRGHSPAMQADVNFQRQPNGGTAFIRQRQIPRQAGLRIDQPLNPPARIRASFQYPRRGRDRQWLAKQVVCVRFLQQQGLQHRFREGHQTCRGHQLPNVIQQRQTRQGLGHQPSPQRLIRPRKRCPAICVQPVQVNDGHRVIHPEIAQGLGQTCQIRRRHGLNIRASAGDRNLPLGSMSCRRAQNRSNPGYRADNSRNVRLCILPQCGRPPASMKIGSMALKKA